MRTLITLAAGIFLSSTALAGHHSRPPQHTRPERVVVVQSPPPRTVVYTRAYAPAYAPAGYVWVDGYWSGRYWVDGYWVEASPPPAPAQITVGLAIPGVHVVLGSRY